MQKLLLFFIALLSTCSPSIGQNYYPIANGNQDSSYTLPPTYCKALGTNTYTVYISGFNLNSAIYPPYISNAFFGYYNGQQFNVKFNHGNTGSATINFNAYGAKDVLKNGSALVSGDIADSGVYTLLYNGTAFNICGLSGSGGGSTCCDIPYQLIPYGNPANHPTTNKFLNFDTVSAHKRLNIGDSATKYVVRADGMQLYTHYDSSGHLATLFAPSDSTGSHNLAFGLPATLGSLGDGLFSDGSGRAFWHPLPFLWDSTGDNLHPIDSIKPVNIFTAQDGSSPSMLNLRNNYNSHGAIRMTLFEYQSNIYKNSLVIGTDGISYDGLSDYNFNCNNSGLFFSGHSGHSSLQLGDSEINIVSPKNLHIALNHTSLGNVLTDTSGLGDWTSQPPSSISAPLNQIIQGTGTGTTSYTTHTFDSSSHVYSLGFRYSDGSRHDFLYVNGDAGLGNPYVFLGDSSNALGCGGGTGSEGTGAGMGVLLDYNNCDIILTGATTVNGDLGANGGLGVGTIAVGGGVQRIAGWTNPSGSGTAGSIVPGTGIILRGDSLSNTAPDQTVVINSGTGISATGTYPNFTITNTSPVSAITTTSPVNISGNTISCATCLVNPFTGATATLPLNISGNTISLVQHALTLGYGLTGTSYSATTTTTTTVDTSGTTTNPTTRDYVDRSNNLYLVATVNATGSSVVNFNNLLVSGYNYEVVVTNAVSATGATTLYMQNGTGGTPTYQTSGYTYGQNFYQQNPATTLNPFPKGSRSGIGIPVCDLEGAIGTFTAMTTTIEITNPAQTSINHAYGFIGQSTFTTSPGGGSVLTDNFFQGMGKSGLTGANNSLRFFWDNNGIFAGGEFQLFRKPL